MTVGQNGHLQVRVAGTEVCVRASQPRETLSGEERNEIIVKGSNESNKLKKAFIF